MNAKLKMLDEATLNFQEFSRKPYTGRGLIIGTDESGEYLVQVYWFAGRSESSRNRVCCKLGGKVWTEVADPNKETGDPETTLYTAMEEVFRRFVVSNGKHTNIVIPGFGYQGGSFLTTSLRDVRYEPDPPNFTPRIIGVCSLDSASPRFEIGIIRKSNIFSEVCERHYYQYEDIPNGFGRCVTTYSDDAPKGQPLPAFTGEPFLMRLAGNAENILERIWYALDENNRVGIVVKMIEIKLGFVEVVLRNKYLRASKHPQVK